MPPPPLFPLKIQCISGEWFEEGHCKKKPRNCMQKGIRYELKIRRTPRKIKMTTVLILIFSNLEIGRTYNRARCADVDINISTLNVINCFGFTCSALECIAFEENKVITAERMQNIHFACVLLESCLSCMDKSTSFIVVFRNVWISV